MALTGATGWLAVRTTWSAPQRAPAGSGLQPRPRIRRAVPATAVGAVTAPSSRKLPRSCVDGVDQLNTIRPGLMSKSPGSPRLSSTGRASCSRVKTRRGPLAVTRSRSGHAASEQRVPLTEVVANAQAGHLRGDPLARLVHAEQLGHGVAQGLGVVIRPAKRALRHRHPQHARTDRMTLGVIGIEQRSPATSA